MANSAVEKTISTQELKEKLLDVLHNDFQTTPEDASDQQVYEALSKIVVGILKAKRRKFTVKTQSEGKKKVYYLSMEFLMGRSLKTSLYNLEMQKQATKVLKDMGISINGIYECEPDAGLGNGGLGRLAACFLVMGFKKSVIAVLLGVLLAGVIMGIASAGVFTAIFSFA